MTRLTSPRSDWNFWTADDPTLGQVNYRSWQDSWNLGLIYSQPGTQKAGTREYSVMTDR